MTAIWTHVKHKAIFSYSLLTNNTLEPDTQQHQLPINSLIHTHASTHANDTVIHLHLTHTNSIQVLSHISFLHSTHSESGLGPLPGSSRKNSSKEEHYGSEPKIGISFKKWNHQRTGNKDQRVSYPWAIGGIPRPSTIKLCHKSVTFCNSTCLIDLHAGTMMWERNIILSKGSQ